MNKSVYALALLPLAAFSRAGDNSDPALSCTLIQDNAVRLACYDKVYNSQLPPRQAIETAAPAPKSVDLRQSYEESRENKSPRIVFADPVEELNLQQAAEAYTPLSQLYDLDKNHESGILSIREHEPMYLLPLWYRSSPNYYPYSPTRGTTTNDIHSGQQRTEAKFQFSIKTKVMEDVFTTRSDLWLGYTQQSNWQVYNAGERSAPFRNSDYAPEIFLTQPVKAELPFGGKLRMLGGGFIHQSNGQSRPLSRSWNRAYLMAGMEWGKLTVIPRLWTRIDPKSADKDDNPDIAKYLGYGDLRLSYRLDDRHTLSSLLRFNPASGKGAVQLNYTFPIRGNLKGYIQGFHGYGESLIDYNHRQTGIGIGVMFNGWNGL